MRNKLTQDTPTLFRDQYGRTIIARSRMELVETAGGGKVSKMYSDKRDGRTVWCGYVVGANWFTAFKWVEVETAP